MARALGPEDARTLRLLQLADKVGVVEEDGGLHVGDCAQPLTPPRLGLEWALGALQEAREDPRLLVGGKERVVLDSPPTGVDDPVVAISGDSAMPGFALDEVERGRPQDQEVDL
jgi:hypothetical protein